MLSSWIGRVDQLQHIQMADASRRRTARVLIAMRGGHTAGDDRRGAVPKTLVVSEALPKPWTVMGDETTRPAPVYAVADHVETVFSLRRGRRSIHKGRLA